MAKLLSPEARRAAIPSEHGGWSLTLEPAILGLLVAFSAAGCALTLAAVLAFIARTPLKIALVDSHRGRWLERSRLAVRILTWESVVAIALVGFAVATTEGPFYWPVVLAAPLIALELWHDMRSRSRYLVPELAGSIGIASIGAIVALAGGVSSGVAGGLWLIMAARSVATIPFVRLQLQRSKVRAAQAWHSDSAQVGAIALGVVGWLTGLLPPAALVPIVGLAAFQFVAVRRPPPRAAVIGTQQVVLGLTLVLIAALAVLAPGMPGSG